MKIVIALGGNAIITKNDKYTYLNLLKNIRKTCKNISKLIKENKAVITHGNGSEIGFLLLQNEIAKRKIPEMPLDVLGAESEGLIGYILQEQLINVLRKNKIKRNVATLITQTLVSKNDVAFKNPTKFIGQFYTEKQIKNLKFTVKKDSNRGYRRVVPSPKPIMIIESNIINKLVEKNYIVVCAGGGGVPVVLENKNSPNAATSTTAQTKIKLYLENTESILGKCKSTFSFCYYYLWINFHTLTVNNLHFDNFLLEAYTSHFQYFNCCRPFSRIVNYIINCYNSIRQERNCCSLFFKCTTHMRRRRNFPYHD